jgi:neutral ceramidase
VTNALDRFLAPVTAGGISPRRARFTLTARTEPALKPEPTLLAGAAEVDITAPPGLPKAGYSRNAHTGIGFRGRLRARVLHLRHGTASVAIVQCDLLGGSAVVQRLVAEAIAERTDVPLAGLFVGATHTHGAPGQFLGTDLYNGFASNLPGFDPAWTAFLVERIASAVISAVETRAEARLAVGTAPVWGLTRNRSLPAHARNPDLTDQRVAAQRTYAAVNPALHLVRADTADGSPLAAMVVFGVHGTGIPMRSKVYNADLWAYVYEALGAGIAQRYGGARPVVGALQGTHADVAPALRPGRAGDVEAARIGRAIGTAAAELHEALAPALTSDVEIGAGLREVDLSTNRTIDGVELPARPALGAALIAGAFENETPVIHRIPPFRAGRPKPHGPSDPQGAKWVIGSRWLQPVVMPLRRFPRVLPVQVVRIGSALLVGLPVEITVEAGRQIADAVAAGTESPRVIVSSVANEYAGYCTTAEEYALQHYEGGHTLYGPRTTPFLAAHAARLAKEVLAAAGDPVADVVAERRFDLHIHRYLQKSSLGSDERVVDGGAVFHDTTPEQDAYWAQRWLGGPPGDLHWHEPLVRIEAADVPIRPLPGLSAQADVTAEWRTLVDDGSCALEVRLLGPAAKGDHATTGDNEARHRYEARWHAPELRDGRTYRFVLPANGTHPEIALPAFT